MVEHDNRRNARGNHEMRSKQPECGRDREVVRAHSHPVIRDQKRRAEREADQIVAEDIEQGFPHFSRISVAVSELRPAIIAAAVAGVQRQLALLRWNRAAGQAGAEARGVNLFEPSPSSCSAL